MGGRDLSVYTTLSAIGYNEHLFWAKDSCWKMWSSSNLDIRLVCRKHHRCFRPQLSSLEQGWCAQLSKHRLNCSAKKWIIHGTVSPGCVWDMMILPSWKTSLADNLFCWFPDRPSQSFPTRHVFEILKQWHLFVYMGWNPKIIPLHMRLVFTKHFLWGW